MSEETENINMTSDDIVKMPQVQLYMKNVPGKGRGVYAGEFIPAHSLINVSPLLLFPEHCDMYHDHHRCKEQQILSHYTYTFGNGKQALALGLGSIFNHSKRNNVGFVIDKSNLLIRYSTLTDVTQDTELCINYGIKVWFTDNDQHAQDVDHELSSDDGLDPFSLMEL